MEDERHHHKYGEHVHKYSHHRRSNDHNRHRSSTAQDGEIGSRSSQSKLTKDSTRLNSRVETSSLGLSKDEKAASEFYSVDRRGDLQNLRYGGLSQYEVSKYRSAGCGRVIGLGSRYRVSRDRRQVEEVQADPVARNRHGHPSLLSTNAEGYENPLQIQVETGPDLVVLQRNYISIGGAKRRHLHRNGSRDLTGLEEEEQSSGAASSSASSDEEVEGQNAYDTFLNDKAHQRFIELDRSTRETPENIDAWLELASHPQSAGVSSIEICERALTKVKSSNGRQKLLLKLLNDGRKLWDTKRLFSKWEAVLKDAGSDSVDLWLGYLDLHQTTFNSFTLDGYLGACVRCLKHARKLQDTVIRDEMSIYTILRCTKVLHHAGFMERAIAIWQCLIEWVFFSSEKDVDDPQEDMLAFEHWWESEVARFGEEGARGWRSNDMKVIQPRSDPCLDSDEKRQSVWEDWATREEKKAESSILPARTLDDVASDDPFRVILFADVKNFIFRPETPEGRRLLCDAFLIFCNMPPLSRQARRWWTDPYVREVALNIDTSASDTTQSTMTFKNAVSNFTIDATMLFLDSQKWFNIWPESLHSDPQANAVDFDWRPRSLRQLVDMIPNADDLAEYVVAYEASIDPAAARRYAKALLKKRPKTLRLYNAFAEVERILGNYGAAEKVWATALSMSRRPDSSELKDDLLLWRTWVWETLERKDHARSIKLLLAVPDGSYDLGAESVMSSSALVESEPAPVPASAFRMLRAQRYLQSRASQRSLFNDDSGIHATDLLAILAYLVNDHSLSAADEVYQRALSSMSPGTASPVILMQMEVLHQCLGRLVHFHTRTYGLLTYRPSEVSLILVASLHQVPDNTILLSIHREYTRHSHLIDRIRDANLTHSPKRGSSRGQQPPIPDHAAQHEQSPASRLVSSSFDIETELARPAFGGRTEHSVRAAFRRALARDTSRAHVSPGLWMSYLQWEVSLEAMLPEKSSTLKSGLKSQKRLRDLFHQALRSCPYSKPLYLLAFTSQNLRSALGETTLHELYETMTEKGLRMFCELHQ